MKEYILFILFAFIVVLGSLTGCDDAKSHDFERGENIVETIEVENIEVETIIDSFKEI